MAPPEFAGLLKSLSVLRQAERETVRGGDGTSSRTATGGMEMRRFCVELLKDESGLTTVEYAVGASVIAAGAALSFGGLGTQVKTIIDALKTQITPK